MPTYDYQCDACGHRFELFQSIKASPIRKCPECGKLKIRRLLGIGAAVIFKGSGFYCTDYRDKSYQADAKKDKPESSSGGDKTAPADKPANNSSEKMAGKPAASSEKSSSEKSDASKSDSSAAKIGRK